MDEDATLELIGTATTLLRFGSFTLLTDPNFLHRGQRAYLGRGLFSRRLTEPTRQPDQLPELDAVLLSHLHGDHFDRVARRGLARDLPVLTTPHARRRLHGWGFAEAVGLDPWETVRLARGGQRLTVTSVPGQHAPSWTGRLLPPVMGSVVEYTRPGAVDPLRVYITGDTLYRPWLREVLRRCGPLDAMVVHLGGTRIAGLLVTMDAEQGASLVRLLEPALTVPVHHSDYTVFRSPLSEFAARWQDGSLPGRLRPVAPGETVSLLP